MGNFFMWLFVEIFVLFDEYFPRFVTCDYVVMFDGEMANGLSRYKLICPISDIYEDEVFDGILEVSYFNLFGKHLFKKTGTHLLPFKNPFIGDGDE